MAENSSIEWTDHTFNPWMGCQKVGPGCDNCYAETLMDKRYGKVRWGAGQPRVRTSASNWHKPYRWQRDAADFFARHARKQRVFCASLADVFDNAVDPAWRTDLADLIRKTPDLDWLLLTKRIGNVVDMLWTMFGFDVPPNVRIGATIVNQAEWNRDAAKIAAVSIVIGKARVFLSMEPLLGPVDLNAVPHYRWQGIVGWVIVGGESGADARPMHPDWVISLRDQCEAASVPFLFKQWGEWAPYSAVGGVGWMNATPQRSSYDGPTLGKVIVPGGEYLGGRAFPTKFLDEGQVIVLHLGKKAAGRLLDGITHDGVPA